MAQLLSAQKLDMLEATNPTLHTGRSALAKLAMPKVDAPPYLPPSASRSACPSPSYTQHVYEPTVLRVVFKKDALPYSSLVDFFFRMHDPTTANRQGKHVLPIENVGLDSSALLMNVRFRPDIAGNDVGTQYRSVIFYHTPEQKGVFTDSFLKKERKLPQCSSPIRCLFTSEVAEQVKAKVQAEHYPNEQVVTEVIPIGQYWPAEVSNP